MKLLAMMLLCFAPLTSTGAPTYPAWRQNVPLGTFQRWFPRQGRQELRAGGISVVIAPLPCDAAHQSEACTFEKVNNQALVTITAPGMEPFSQETDSRPHITGSPSCGSTGETGSLG